MHVLKWTRERKKALTATSQGLHVTPDYQIQPTRLRFQDSCLQQNSGSKRNSGSKTFAKDAMCTCTCLGGSVGLVRQLSTTPAILLQHAHHSRRNRTVRLRSSTKDESDTARSVDGEQNEASRDRPNPQRLRVRYSARPVAWRGLNRITDGTGSCQVKEQFSREACTKLIAWKRCPAQQHQLRKYLPCLVVV